MNKNRKIKHSLTTSLAVGMSVMMGDGFRPALPRIPQELLRAIIGFFRSQMESGAEFEALVRIYWDREEQKFIPFVPKQRATKDSVTVRLTDEDLPDDTRYL